MTPLRPPSLYEPPYMLVQSFTVFVYRVYSSPTGPDKGGHGRGTTLGDGAAEARPAWAHSDLLNPHPGPPPTPRTPPPPGCGGQGREGATTGASNPPARVLRPSGAPHRSRQQPCQPPGTIRRPWDHPQPLQLPPPGGLYGRTMTGRAARGEDGKDGHGGGRAGGGRHRARQRGGGGYGAEDRIQIGTGSA